MNTHNTETKPAAVADRAIIAANRFSLAVAMNAAAIKMTGLLPPGPDFDEAERQQATVSRELDAARADFARTPPTTPLAFAVWLDAFKQAAESEHAAEGKVFDEWDDEGEDPVTYASLIATLCEAYRDIFTDEKGGIHESPPAAHRSKALDEQQVRNRMMDLCDVLQLHAWQIEGALESDDALIAFATKHGESLDWIVLGDEAARRHCPK